LLGSTLCLEFDFACFAVGKLSLAWPEAGLGRSLLEQNECVKLFPPSRRSFIGNPFTGAQADAKRTAGIDMTFRAAGRQNVSDRTLEHRDFLGKLDDP
jgi:hypothetical protein